MSVTVITPPASLVDLDSAKEHLGVETNEKDAMIDGYIAAASAWIDGPGGWLGRCLAEQTLELRGHVFAACDRLPYGPVSTITEVKYVDPQGVEQTLDPAIYSLTSGHLTLSPGKAWPAVRGDAEGVRVRYIAGSKDYPMQARQAVLLLVGQWFAVREAVNVGNIVNEMPFAVEALLQPLRSYRC